MNNQRKFQVLKIIVENFIETSEPIGSEVLLEKYDLKCSSATIRNIMAELEKEGYIEKQHISSGRIPSSKGYQYYLDNLNANNLANTVDVEFQQEFQKILEESSNSVEDALERSCNLLSDMTKTATIVLGPKAEEERLISLQLIKLSENQTLGILVTDSGHIEKKTFVIAEKDKVDIDSLIDSVKVLNDRLSGSKLTEIESKAKEIAPIIMNLYGNSGEFILNAFLEAVLSFTAKRYEVFGRKNLLTSSELLQNTNSLNQAIKALDNPQNIEKSLSYNDDLGGVKVGFTDNSKGELAVISRNLFGKDSIAVLGPKRMNYKKVISILEYIAYMMEKKFNTKKTFNNLVPINDTIIKGDLKTNKKGVKKKR